MKTVAYVRVSTSGQDTSSQKDKLATYATERQIEVSDWFVDEAISGTAEERPQLEKLKQWCMDNPGGRVLCLGLDRQARDMYVYVSLERHFQQYSITPEYLGFSSTGNVATDTLMKNILASFAAYELDVIKERMNRGKRYLLKQGKLAMGGQPSFGYRFVGNGRDKTLEIDQIEAVIVKKIFELYVEKDSSVRSIMKYLNEQNINTSKRGRNREGKKWAVSSLNHILRNTSYIGKFVYGKTKTVGYGKTKKEVIREESDDGFIEIKVPSIVSPALFKKAQVKLDGNSKAWRKMQTLRHTYILKGLLHCGVCGKYMFSGTGHNSGYSYYRCNSINHKEDVKNCTNPTLKGNYVEALVISELQKLLDGGNKSRMREMVDRFKNSLQEQTDKYIQAVKDLKEYKEATERLLDKLGRGVITDDDYKAQAQRYRNEALNCAIIIKEHGEYIEKLQKLDIAFIRDGLKKISGKERDVLDKAVSERNHEVVRDIIFKYITQITVYPDKLDIKFTLPTMEDTIVTMNNSSGRVGTRKRWCTTKMWV